MQCGWVYILANSSNSVLYVGVTSNLHGRIKQHRLKIHPKSFTARYNVFKLIYFMAYTSMQEAIREEKRLKGGSREAKLHLAKGLNPDLIDLFEKIH